MLILPVLLTLLSASALAQTGQPPAAARLDITRDSENLIAARLPGSWVLEDAITSRLGALAPGSGAESGRSLRFEADDSVLGSLPGRVVQSVCDLPIYLAGRLSVDDGPEVPFVLTVRHGNPQVLAFQEVDSDHPVPEATLLNVSLAAAADWRSDILLLGGGEPLRSSAAFVRSLSPGDPGRPDAPGIGPTDPLDASPTGPSPTKASSPTKPGPSGPDAAAPATATATATPPSPAAASTTGPAPASTDADALSALRSRRIAALDATLDAAIATLRQRRYAEFLDRFALPPELIAATRDRSFPALAEDFGKRRAGRVLEYLTACKTRPPLLDAQALEAVYELGDGRAVHFLWHEGRWCLAN